MADAVTLRPLTYADLPLLTRWIAAPHVARWWSEDPAGTPAHYAPTITRADPTRVQIIVYRGDAVGMVQTYDHRDEPDWDRAIDIERAVGIDYLIGETDALRQGVGTAAIRTASACALQRHPAADVVVAAPQAANTASCRTLERAGFVLLDQRMLDSDDPADAGLASVYAWHRPAADPALWADGVAELVEAYESVGALVDRLDDAALDGPTRCTGWSVGDVLDHLTKDAHRAAQTFAAPSLGPVDRDRLTYWRDFPPGEAAVAEPEQGRRGTARQRQQWAAASAAAIASAGQADPRGLLQTQGHVLTVADFLGTLVLEATVHLLDAGGSPRPRALTATVRTLGGLTGGPLAGWDEVGFLLRATGRQPLSEAERTHLGDRALAFPALG